MQCVSGIARKQRPSLLYALLLLAACLFSPQPACAAQVPFSVPYPLAAQRAGETPKAVMDRFLAIPYRPDGMVDDAGRYALFASPQTTLPAPGLNCSGLVLQGARLLFARNIPFVQAIHDRLNDSGKNAPRGEDWDFGWDIVMNISEGHDRTLIAPGGDMREFASFSGTSSPGFALHEETFWSAFLPRIKPGKLYLLSFSRHKSTTAPAHLHYHVGLLFRGKEENTPGTTAPGPAWFYHTIHNGGPARLNLETPEGKARFAWNFRNTKNSLKRVSVIEIPMPGTI